MSITGLTKQFNKVNQYMSEKILNAEGTKHDDEFNESEKLTHSLASFVHDVQGKAVEMVQPNPAIRYKYSSNLALRAGATMKSLSNKVQGKTTKSGKYHQTEQEFADLLEKYANELDSHPSNLAAALRNLAEGYGQMAEIKDNLDTGVQQTFLEPLACLESKEIKSILANLKKLESRRLDYDYKRKQKEKGKQVSEVEMSVSEEKFKESKETCESAMRLLIQSNVEQLSTIKTLIDLQIDYFSKSLTVLRKMQSTLQTDIEEAKCGSGSGGSASGDWTTPSVAPRIKSASAASTPSTQFEDSNNSIGSFGNNNNNYNGFGTSTAAANENNNNVKNNSFKLQPPPSLGTTNASLSSSTPSDLNQFGNCNNNNAFGHKSSNGMVNVRNSEMAYSSIVLNGSTSGTAPIQDPWELPPAPSQANPFDSTSNSNQVWNNSNSLAAASSTHPVPAVRKVSSPANVSSGLYPSLSLVSTAPSPPNIGRPPPVAPKPANLGPPPALPAVPRRPHCIAKFDFQAETNEELAFKEGEKIMLTSQIDENWFEGRIDGSSNNKVGRFPVNYVHVIVPI